MWRSNFSCWWKDLLNIISSDAATLYDSAICHVFYDHGLNYKYMSTHQVYDIAWDSSAGYYYGTQSILLMNDENLSTIQECTWHLPSTLVCKRKRDRASKSIPEWNN